MILNQTNKHYPLTSVQKEIWFDQILYPDIPLYNIGGYLRIDGPIDPMLFEKTVNQVIEDNDALRIIIHEGESLPTQTFLENVSVKLDIYDFSEQKNARQSALEWMQHEFVKPFSLYNGLLFEFALCKVSANCYYWFKKYHHLIVDGYAISLIVQRAAAAYNALADKQSNVEQIHYSYLDFIQNDQAYLNSDKFIQQQRYWLEKYREVPEPLLTRRYAAQFAGQMIPSQRSILHLQRSLYNQLIQFARVNNASTFHVILGVLYCYFVRTSNRKEVVIGLPTLNRSTAAFKQTIGLFTGITPAWFRFGIDLNFVELIQALKGELQKNYRYQRFPVSEINRQLGLHKEGRQQLFDIELSYMDNDYDTHFAGSPVEMVGLHQGFEKNALLLYINEFNDQHNVKLDFDYNFGTFHPEEIEYLKTRFEFLLGEILRKPSVPIRELQIMPHAELKKVLIEFNQTTTAYPSEKTIIALFEEQVDKTPEAIAVIFENQSVTYQALNLKANQLAHYLQQLGVKQEMLVGINLERSIEMLIGLLAVFKAGGAYLPLDPTYPMARLALILEEAQISVLLTQSSFTSRLPEIQAQVICLDTEADILSQYSGENPCHRIKPENLAYVIYTSGSTGKPKGVMIEHQGMLNHIYAKIDDLQLTASDIIAQTAALTFDISVWQFFTALLLGGRVCILNEEVATQPVRLLKELVQQKITILEIVPALLRAILEETKHAKTHFDPSQLRWLILTGEALPPSLCTQWLAKYPSIPLFNAYGPTECSDDVSHYPIHQSPAPELNQLPIGKAVNNMQLYVLDAYLQPTPIGVAGELCVGGIGVGRGYLKAPEKTATAFIPDLLNQKNGARLYKTGDLARYLPDGNIEYLGRIDNQVKIRGFRIELGEIEAVLEQHPSVQQNAVIIYETEETGKRLIACIIAQPTQTIEPTDIQAFLKKRLPDYMVPSFFLTLETIPLTPNGKIDRQALVGWVERSETHLQLSSKNVILPRTEEEELLANIWTEILGIEPIGIHDNFFELGGHSLLATQVISRIRDTFDLELPLRHFFESPTIAALNEQLNTARQQSTLPPITPISRDQALSLSFAQQRLWFFNQLEGPSPTYNVPLALHLEGQLQQNALKQSLQALVQRHENLRTAFPTVNGIATIQISKQPFQLDIIDLRTLSPEEQAIKVQQLVKENVSYRFDLETAPLFRAVLLQLQVESHILLLNMHHIISDEWSHGILVREWRTFYEAFLQGKPSPLSPLPIQYIDFAHWQRQWLTGEVLEQQVAYWKQQLAGAPALLEMPTDHPRQPEQNYQGVRLPIEFGLELTTQLKQLSRQTGTTLFMVLWSAFATLLSRYTGQSDIVIGSPIANRTHSQTESLIGFFVNTLVLRLDLSNNPPFEHILRQARRVALEAYTHQDIPFERLVEELNPERSLSYSPLFQVMLALQNTPMSSLELPELRLTPVKMENVVAKFDLTLDIDETAEGLVGEIEYDTELFEATTIERMIGHLKTLLTNVVKNPQSPIHQLPLLTEAEQQQFIVWNNTKTDYPRDKTLIDLFEEQVKKTPEAIAVVFEAQSLTYRELNTKANQLGHHLQKIGVKPEVLVGICLTRSLEMVIGLLGILKAGGAYLPLDPEYPVERLAFMLQDAQVPVLLTQSHLTEKLPNITALMVCLDVNLITLSQLATENPVSEVKPENLAYVIYTSGSTGKPKGTLIIHQGLMNYLYWSLNAYQVVEGLGSPVHLSLGFDATITSLFLPLLAGQRILLLPDKQEIEALVTAIQSFQNWSLIKLTPAHLEILNSLLSKEQLSGKTRFLILGGEALPSPSLSFWRTTAPETKIINEYGPTETVVGCCVYEVDANTPYQGIVPIGHPIANTQLYILDNFLQPLPMGVPGELYIGGEGVARGYLNRPELTAERFIKNPFSDDSNSRLYKTGDLARYLSDGNIEYLGRIDNQVKIHGFRIELGEIEAVLQQHPFVQENAVIVHEGDGTSKRLVAYLVQQPEQTLENQALREFLKERLPAYMVPSNFVVLEALPLTPNGKIDRQVLVKWAKRNDPSQLVGWVERSETHQLPRTSEEKLLADIWAEVLGIERVGIHDNFFEIGGDSIISIQVISRANQAGLHLTPRQLFQHQTIAELAQVVNTTTTSSCQAEQGLVTGSVPLTPIQHWFFEQKLPEAHHYNQSVLLEVSPALQPEQLEIIISQLLQHHDALRLRFLDNNQQQIITDNCSLFTDNCSLITVNDLSELTVTEQSAKIKSITAELQASLNLTEGSLLQVALFQLGHQAANCLFFAIHHLAIDGVSWRILLEDFAAAWQQLSRGETITLPPKTTSFQQWAKHLVEYAVSDSLVAELDDWLIEAYSQLKPLPVDYPAKPSANIFANVSEVTVSLNVKQTHALLSEVPKAYRTQINDILLTALAQSLAKWTDEKVFLINLEGHGREELFDEVDLSRTVGWFTSVFPVLLDLRTVANNKLGTALKTIKEQLRRIPHHGIGYGLLRYLNTDTASRIQTLPQAQISFNYLGQFQNLSIDPLLNLVSEDNYANSSALNSFSYLLEINSLIKENQLHLSWNYSKAYFDRTTIENLAQNFITALQALIAHCQVPETRGYTPSDFPLARLQQATLDKTIGQRQIDDLYPLSPMQAGMLFHTLYEPETSLYFDQLFFTIDGVLNITAFQQAWQQVAERHAVLRTACVWDGLEKPLQIVFTEVQIPWVKQDWRELSTSQQQEQLAIFLKTDKAQAVDITVAPLMRCALIQLKEDQYYLIWTHHHILLDGWAVPIIFNELFSFYASNCQGSSLHLAPVRPYREYIAWLQQQDLKSAQTFWQTQLAGFSAPTPLGVDKLVDKTSVATQYGEQTFHLSLSTTEALQSLAKTHHVTLNTLIQGAWALLLSCYSGENDVVFGVVVSGRPTALAGVENMVGLFINTLPMRVSVSPNALLLPWLQGLYSKQIESDEYSYALLVDIQGWSEVKGGVSLFDSLLIFENYPIDESLRQGTMGSLTIHSIQAIEKTNYPLELEVMFNGNELKLTLSYILNRFDPDTVTRMMGHVRTLLEGMIIAPETRRLGDIPLLTEAEQQQFLAWNDTTRAYPRDKSVIDLFEEQVDKTPEAIAVVFENQQLTYQAFNAKVNQLAHYLQYLGVQPEVIVGICLERSLEMAIGIFGVLKAGGAYLPLDPDSPIARLQWVLEEAQVPILLTQTHLTNQLSDIQAQQVCLDVETEWSHYGAENPLVGAKPENLAYVIYTSGSTGTPKGVMLEHRGLFNHVYAKIHHDFHLTATDIIAQTAPITFDISVWQFVTAPLTGGRVCIFNKEAITQPAQLLKEVILQRITVLEIVPSVLRAMLEEINRLEKRPDLSMVRWLIPTGEALPPKLCAQWLAVYPSLSILNAYGPTECSDDVSYYHITQPPSSEVNQLPIGKPINNMQFYVLDSQLQSVPIGVAGELYIGGIGVGRGYLSAPEKTADAFLPDPFSQKPGVRFYKTGDLVRYLPDGNLEYLGRIDNQVKVRGFRIELGEIEAVLEQHPSVQENAVIVHETEETGKRLVAYLVAQPEQLIENTELPAFLQERLPHYMVPSSFVTLEAMPLTPNGKIDRRALARLSLDNDLLSAKTFVAPQTPEEELLANIWADVLSIPQMGIHDNFFELGGHSLLATQVMSRIRDTFAIELPLRDLFESPTLLALSTRLKLTRQQSPLQAITPINRSESLPLSFAQQRLWFLNQLEGPSATYNMPEALRLEGPLQQPTLIQSLQELVQRHESLRTIFPTIHGKPSIQIVVNHFRLLIIDLSHLTPSAIDSEVHRLVDEDAQRPFDLENEPLFRATLLKVSTTLHVLLLNMHHIISDGWSTEVLVREWGMLYEAFSQGKPSPLSPLPIQYVDYAHWQRQWLTGEVLEKQVAYWKQQLAGSPALLELPTDKPRPPVQSFQGTSLPLQLNSELTAKLKQLSQQTGVTLFMTLWSAFATLLYRYSGQTDIVIGSPIANRTLSQTESVVGFFVNTLVLRLNLSNNPSFETLLQQARRVALEAYTHQDIPFESVVDELKPARNLSHSPLFQVMLVLQNTLTSDSEVNLAGLNVAPIEREQVIAKFDLTLALEERDEGLAGELEYNTDLFESATIARWIEHFKILLSSLVTHPQQPIHELPLLTETEQRQLLVWNETNTDYPRDKTVVELFEEQVNKTPDAIAVVFENQQLSYQALNTKANQLAHYLQTFGVKPEALTGICLERSLEMIIGLLGILKAGGAYLPLDPAYPLARLAFMLEDAQISVLLTHSNLKEKLPETATTKIYLDIEAEKISRLSTENPVNKAKPENLAYVIYTSGSTGQSKGVLLEQGGLCNLAQAEIKAFGIQSDSRILQFASLSFDVATSDIAMAFASGATLNLITQDATLSPQELIHILKEQAITHFEIPASVLTTLPVEKLPTLQAFIVGGEACPPNLVAQWSTEQRFFNAYGPTEGTVCATFFENQGTSLSTLPIGKPIANTQAYILDTYLQQCPVGIPGELHIGGIGLARSYLNRPDLTAERFIKNPFSQAPNARLYKTGDLARYLPDGNIEYLGRIDNQVKIRGFRIELGEIETVLGQHKAVRENAVIVHESSLSDKRLIAYIVLHPSLQIEQIETKELHDFLKERLPTYMIPAAFFTLEALPLTPNGKIDRQALVGWVERSETHQLEFSTENFVPPQTQTEELLATIWMNVLNLEQVGIHDNFFELGGDSIISIQVISRANQAGLQLTPKQLFQHQTIVELAIVAQTTGRSYQAEQGLVTGEVPLTPIQHWFFAQQLPEAHHFNQAVLLKVSPKLQPEQLEIIISQLLQHHDVLRLRFVEGEKPVNTDNCSLITDNESLITIKDLSHLHATEQTSVIEATTTELQARLNFEKGPLLRVALFFVGAEQPNRLFLVIHHLAIDGVSWRILWEDFVTAWQQLSRGENIVLPPKTTSFQQWAKRLTAYAVSEPLLAELEKWITQAHWQVKPLPVDSHSHQALPNTVANAKQITVSLNQAQTHALLNEVPATYQTQINDILLTALVQSFAEWTGEKLLLIDLEGHGREELFTDIDLSRTVGWFTSQFPVLLDLRSVANESGAAIKAIKEQLRQIPQHGIGYGILRYLNSDTAAQLKALPQAQVVFNYLGQFQDVSIEPLLGFASEDSGADSSPLNHRVYLLEINGSITEEQLQLTWSYSQNDFQSATIEQLAQNFIIALQTLITHCQSPEVGGYTPSDFSTTELSQEMLDDILDEFGEEE